MAIYKGEVRNDVWEALLSLLLLGYQRTQGVMLECEG